MTRFNDLLVLAIVLATTTTLFAQDAVQWRVEDGGNGHWYAKIETSPPVTAEEHFLLAESLGGYTATISSAEEHDFVYSVNTSSSTSLIGLRKVEGSNTVTWITGEPVTFLNWHSGEGSNTGERYANLQPIFSGRWQDTDNTPKESSIVEWSADCNGDGTVDYGQILDGTLDDDDGDGVPDLCDAVQWRVEDGGNGHWYAIRPEGLTWWPAQTKAAGEGGHLASITSVDEENFLKFHMEADGAWIYQIGGLQTSTDVEPDGNWEWLTGEPMDYMNWNPNAPDDGGGNSREHLMCFNYEYPDGGWNDMTGSGTDQYIVEWSADCNGDGIVDYGQILDGTLADDNGDGVPDVCVAVQWRVEDGGNGHWYRVVIYGIDLSWAEANDLANMQGGFLASLTSAGENSFAHQLAQAYLEAWSENGPWLGGYKNGDEWDWTSGEEWNFSAWAKGNPSGDGDNLAFWDIYDAAEASWNDAPESNTMVSYLIEWSADCNGDGIVDYGQILDGTFTDCNGNLIPDVCEISDTFAASVDRTPESITDFIEFDVSAMADANDTVSLGITAVGDLAGSGEFLWIYLDNTLLDLVFVDDGAACEEVSTTLSILATEWNDAGADGSRLVKISGTNVDPDACSEPFVGISVIVPIPFADCDDSGTWDVCDIAGGLASDLDGNGVPDSCDPDCDGDGEPDAYEISSGQELDCNANEIPDNCDIGDGGSSSDIDSDGVPDDCQPDCDGDGVPDSWELSEGLAMDCNDNGYPDNCDILESSSNDIDSNGVPDECKDDCNGNGIPDYWEIKQGDVADCNSNGIPDPCDIAAGNLPDCDNDLISDDCAIADGVVADCNDNGFPDSCDIADGFDEDDNENGIPDACELAAGDLNLDGCIDGADLAVLLGLWGFPNPPIGDLNGDGTIGGADLASLLGSWRPCGG